VALEHLPAGAVILPIVNAGAVRAHRPHISAWF
jgi:hypothetical protein